MEYILYSDGGARGNPGPSGCGFVIKDNKRENIYEGSVYIGETTNNQAEYQALLFGLEKIKELGNVEKVTCYLDSELAVKQLNRIYKMKNQDLKIHFDKINIINYELGNVISFHHVLREKNKEADALANEAMDRKK